MQRRKLLFLVFLLNSLFMQSFICAAQTTKKSGFFNKRFIIECRKKVTPLAVFASGMATAALSVGYYFYSWYPNTEKKWLAYFRWFKSTYKCMDTEEIISDKNVDEYLATNFSVERPFSAGVGLCQKAVSYIDYLSKHGNKLDNHSSSFKNSLKELENIRKVTVKNGAFLMKHPNYLAEQQQLAIEKAAKKVADKLDETKICNLCRLQMIQVS
ncbi:hypothetical protein IPH25_02655 [bacterium]|nr:MAG: hypothetical protein IPG37_04795 [bacterium]QQR62319.1 MAG: hypothetical protein IPH25_02655 [bacterium]QQR63114.1 MAG: hypothetical protein IPH67_01395 [bacterium]